MNETISPEAAELASWIEDATGDDPFDMEEVFQLRENIPCDHCHTVTATALLIVDWTGNGAMERLCLNCAANA